MRRMTLRVFILLILLSIPVLVLSANQRSNSNRNQNYNRSNSQVRGNYDPTARNRSAAGTIRSIDIRNKMITISGDSKYSAVIVDSATKIYAKSGKRLSLNQLRQGDDIKVAGGQIRNNMIHAVDIYISINGSIYNPSRYSNDNHGQTGISITAVVSSYNSSNGRLKIRSARSYNTVIVNSNTRVYNSNGRSTSMRNLQQGDAIKIKGYTNRNNVITATEIRQQ